MGTIIHSIVKDDKRQYRIWSTVSGTYVTEPVNSEESLRTYLLSEAVQEAVTKFEAEFPHRLQRAISKGTSCRINSRQRVDDWDDERQ